MDRGDVQRWVEAYVKAWETNDPQDIAALFTEDAVYYTAPHREPWRGRDAIVAGWLGRKDEPGDWWTFEFRVQDVVGNKGYVRGTTRYQTDESDYSNLWEVTLDDEGRCSEFVEWWMEMDSGAG